MDKKFLQLNDIDAYKTAFHLSNYIWDLVMNWSWFAQKHVGGQFVEAADSVSANLAEGFGRYTKKDKIRIYRISQGSLKECFDWNQKAKVRKLLSIEEYNHILKELQKLPKEINQLIMFTNEKLKR